MSELSLSDSRDNPIGRNWPMAVRRDAFALAACVWVNQCVWGDPRVFLQCHAMSLALARFALCFSLQQHARILCAIATIGGQLHCHGVTWPCDGGTWPCDLSWLLGTCDLSWPLGTHRMETPGVRVDGDGG